MTTPPFDLRPRTLDDILYYLKAMYGDAASAEPPVGDDAVVTIPAPTAPQRIVVKNVFAHYTAVGITAPVTINITQNSSTFDVFLPILDTATRGDFLGLRADPATPVVVTAPGLALQLVKLSVLYAII